MIPASILIISSDSETQSLLQQAIAKKCTCPTSAAAGKSAALNCFDPQTHELIFIDSRTVDPKLLTTLADIQSPLKNHTVVLLSHGRKISLGMEDEIPGIYEILHWPASGQHLASCIDRALERCMLIREKKQLQLDCRCHKIFAKIAGQSKNMQKILDSISTLAHGNETVFITGESGTGKELAARTLHRLSSRSGSPFIRVHCPSLPEESLIDEIFFRASDTALQTTDSHTFLNRARGGTLFLDEIGDISSRIQDKLLEYLKETPEPSYRSANIRLLIATNRDLGKKTESHAFSKELFEILSTRHIHLPPLRRRPEDIPPLAHFLLEKQAYKLKRYGRYISPELMKRLMAHPWEGNIRELENTIIHGLLFSSSQEIGPDDVLLSGPKPLGPCSAALHQDNYRDAKEEALKGFNHIYIGRLLKRSNGNISLAARACGLERQALQQIMKRYDISPVPYRPKTGCDGGYPE
ncbi:sigma-54-dependent transcriptional regulator [Desulfobotulus mexicanus]|uniref:Sigma-54-dependent Fis family transcriptional regulator n=1 Tax=Desulfobotulus mexicanus TaxID=2586642 RepID=A0A5Q4VAV8_9BACT|nr:sigma 54-interacting transcriptional regulator [Desulfobotulus mexicanus]TYT74884.1 sigma-54-dependent Fis family transcriptional regulator [Desulfobotulus mexicanus]